MTFLKSKRIWLSVLVLVVAVGLMPRQSGEQSVPDQISSLIVQLGDSQFRKREKASAALKKFGERALPALRKAAAASAQLEVRARALQLIAVILREASRSKSTGLEMTVIKPGVFQMGSGAKERGRKTDELSHRVRITKPFLLGKYEVTQGQFQKIMKRNPSWFAKSGPGERQVRGFDANRFPVENVTWFDAIEFCNLLSIADKHAPYYKLDEVVRKDKSITKAKVSIVGGNGYRLPTEAEWEYACRARTTSPFHYGNTTKKGQANLKSTQRKGAYGIRLGWPSIDQTITVGSYPANPWRIHDMHGNIAEWCWDHYDKDYYKFGREKDPQGPPTRYHRVVRGGSWLVFESSCRSASRDWMTPGQLDNSTGFRVARTP